MYANGLCHSFLIQVPARKLPVLKSPGLRGKRKRAVDFFNDELLAATVQVPLNGGVSSPLTQAKAQESEQGGFKGNPGSDVLEKAYHAAMALAATAQTSHTDDVPMPRPKYASDDDALPKISDSHLDKKLSLLRSPRGSTRESETSLEDTVSAKPPEMSSAVPHDASGRMESTRKGNATTFMDEGTRAVDAEGLIWVDKSEATAYSVRYVLHGLVKLRSRCRWHLHVTGNIHFTVYMAVVCTSQLAVISCLIITRCYNTRYWQARIPD